MQGLRVAFDLQAIYSKRSLTRRHLSHRLQGCPLRCLPISALAGLDGDRDV